MIPWFFGHFWKCSEVVEFWHVDTFKNGRKIKGSFLLWALQLYTDACALLSMWLIPCMSNLDFFFSLYAYKDCSLHWSSVCKHCSYPSLRHWPWSRTCTAQGNGQKWFFFFFFFFFYLFAFDKEQVLTWGENLVSDFNQNGIFTMK